MKIDLKNLFSGGTDRIDVDGHLHFDDLLYSGYNPIPDGVHAQGCAYTKADVAYLDLDISFRFSGVCDRCAEPIEKQMRFSLHKILVEDLQNQQDSAEDYLLVRNSEIDLDALVQEEIILFLPMKMLCKDDCKGLCSQCGQNLNIKKCSCKKEVDPRMSALLQLLDEE